MVISKKRSFFGQTLLFLPLRKPGLYISRLLFFSFLNTMNYSKHCSQHYSIIKILNYPKIVFFFVGLALFVVVTVLFSRLWVSFSYLFFFLSENPPSYIHICVLLKLLTTKAHSEPTQTSKMELFAKETAERRLTNFAKSSIADV